jgi:hypothetical protein
MAGTAAPERRETARPLVSCGQRLCCEYAKRAPAAAVDPL